jgi:hypothetical protein
VTSSSAMFWFLWGVLFVSVPVWFWLVNTLYKRLESSHTAKFRAMGEPGLIRNNRPGSGLRLMKFIFTREDRPLSDPQVSRLTAFMLAFSICYLAIFLFLVSPFLLAIVLVMLGVRGS